MVLSIPIIIMVRVFTDDPGDWGSILGWVILDAFLLNTQHYKVLIKGKYSNPGKGVVPSVHLSVVAIEKGAFGSPSTTVKQFYLFI